MVDLAEQVLVAIGQREAAVDEAEKRVGEALRELTEVEGLSPPEAVEWCGETVTVRQATRLRRLAAVDQDDSAPATTATAESGELVPVRRLDDAGLAALAAAIADPRLLDRYRAKGGHGAGKCVPVTDRRSWGPVRA